MDFFTVFIPPFYCILFAIAIPFGVSVASTLLRIVIVDMIEREKRNKTWKGDM